MSLTPQQIAERQTGIGGSDAPAALGLSTWGSAIELYGEKRGELVRPSLDDRPWIRWGQLLEPVIRQQYAERTGRTVRLPTETLRHPKWRFMVAHPDGVVAEERRGYEGKIAVTGEGWGEPGTDQVPQPYTIQVQHYMVVMELDIFDLAVLIGNCDFRIYEIPADRELQEMIIEGEAAFWSRVERGEPPPPDWESPRVLDVVKRLCPGTNGQRLIATAEQAHWRAVLDEAREKTKIYTQAADAALAHLIYEMGPAAQLAFPDGKALRRKLVKRAGYTVKPGEYMDTRIVNDND